MTFSNKISPTTVKSIVRIWVSTRAYGSASAWSKSWRDYIEVLKMRKNWSRMLTTRKSRDFRFLNKKASAKSTSSFSSMELSAKRSNTSSSRSCKTWHRRPWPSYQRTPTFTHIIICLRRRNSSRASLSTLITERSQPMACRPRATCSGKHLAIRIRTTRRRRVPSRRSNPRTNTRSRSWI